MKLGDCRIAFTVCRIAMSTELPAWLPIVVARVTKRIVSADVSGRRNARRPIAEIARVRHAVSVIDCGTHGSTLAARVASANANDDALRTAVSYNPTPFGETATDEAPIVAKPSTKRSSSTPGTGAALPNRSCTLFANSTAVSL